MGTRLCEHELERKLAEVTELGSRRERLYMYFIRGQGTLIMATRAKSKAAKAAKSTDAKISSFFSLMATNTSSRKRQC